MPARSCRQNPRGSSPSSPTAWSTTCWIRARSQDRALGGRPLLQAQRDEAQLAVGSSDQQQRRGAAVLSEPIHLGLEVVGGLHRLLRDFNNHIAGVQPFVGGRRAWLDAKDDNAFDGV